MSGVLRFHDLTYKLLGNILKIAVGSVTWSVSSLASKTLAQLSSDTLKDINSTGKDPEKEIKRIIYYAKQRGYLNPKLQTTKKGAKQLSKIEFQTLPMTEPWDGNWRIVMYDIPETQRAARDQVRRLIKQLGFVQLQQSVWIHPLPCLEQFEIIKDANSLESSLVLITTDNLKDVDLFIPHFKKLYPKIKF